MILSSLQLKTIEKFVDLVSDLDDSLLNEEWTRSTMEYCVSLIECSENNLRQDLRKLERSRMYLVASNGVAVCGGKWK